MQPVVVELFTGTVEMLVRAGHALKQIPLLVELAVRVALTRTPH
jgi:hypothetical protein